MTRRYIGAVVLVEPANVRYATESNSRVSLSTRRRRVMPAAQAFLAQRRRWPLTENIDPGGAGA
jgi:hypothetical protein